MSEIWRSIPDFAEYEVSSFGRVKSLKRISRRHYRRGKEWRERIIPECVLRAEKLYKGHLRVPLYKDKKCHRFLVHHLVLVAFAGPCPKGMECRHLDGNPANNKVKNLKWGTPEENWQDRRRHGNGFVDYCTNTSGVRGVSFDKRSGKWHAYIGYAPRNNLGLFAAKSEAVMARLHAEACRT